MWIGKESHGVWIYTMTLDVKISSIRPASKTQLMACSGNGYKRSLTSLNIQNISDLSCLKGKVVIAFAIAQRNRGWLDLLLFPDQSRKLSILFTLCHPPGKKFGSPKQNSPPPVILIERFVFAVPFSEFLWATLQAQWRDAQEHYRNWKWFGSRIARTCDGVFEGWKIGVRGA